MFKPKKPHLRRNLPRKLKTERKKGREGAKERREAGKKGTALLEYRTGEPNPSSQRIAFH